MRRLICTFVVRIGQKQVFSSRGSYGTKGSYRQRAKELALWRGWAYTFEGSQRSLFLWYGSYCMFVFLKAILMSMCLQGMVEELIMKKQGKKIKKVGLIHTSICLSVMKWRSAWPIFQGPVILPYILKTSWCMNIILLDCESLWPDVWLFNI